MKTTDCDLCKHGTRSLALNAEGNPIPKDWSQYSGGSMGTITVDKHYFWTYLTCKKNTFSITSPCPKFERSR